MTKPSLSDFGTHDESAHPELWDGVVGAWAPCLGPTGSRLHDHSRRANWGTLTNMDNATDWVVSDGQYALDFDGSNDHVPCGTQLNTLLGGQLTISCWVSLRNYSSDPQSIVSNITTNGSAGSFQLEFSRTLGRISFLTSGNVPLASVVYATPAINDAAWRHVVAVRSGNTSAWTITLGVNAVFNSVSQQDNPTSTRGQVTIGRAGDFNGQYLDAIVSDLAIWNRPLSENEIHQLYNLGRGGMYTRRTRRSFYIPAGFNASWARNSNVLLGAGATC